MTDSELLNHIRDLIDAHRNNGQAATARAATPSRWSGIFAFLARKRVFMWGLVIASVILFTPLPSHAPGSGIRNIFDLNVDVDFQLAMVEMFLRGIPYGPQGIFTYGPLGWLVAMWLPSSLVMISIMANMLVVAVFATSVGIATYDVRGRAGRVAVIAVATLVAVAFLGWTALCYAGVCIAAFVHLGMRGVGGRRKNLLIALFAVTCAFVALIKFNYFILGGLAFGLLAAIDLARRRIPVAGLAYLACLIIAWSLAGQRLWDIPVWVWYCLDLASGYPEAMARDFDSYSTRSELLFYLACIVPPILVATHRQSGAEAKLLRLAFALLIAFVMYTSVKHAFGGNQLEQAAAVVVFMCIAAAWFLARDPIQPAVTVANHSVLQPRPPYWKAWACLTCAVLALGVGFAYNMLIMVPSAAAAWGRIRAQLDTFALVARGDFTAFGNSHSGILRDIGAATRPPADIAGTADAYPHGAGIIIAESRLAYLPRPAFLSLNAHTEKLARRNAEFVSSPSAAQNLLFRILPPEASVHRRFPSTDDGPSWPEILARYEVIAETSAYLVLQRRKPEGKPQSRSLQTIDAAWNEWVTIPATPNTILWVEADVRKTWFGRLAYAVYKSPHVKMEVRTRAGATNTWQIVPGLRRAGFMLSPLITDTAKFRRLARPASGANLAGMEEVEAVRWTSPLSPSGFWRDQIQMRMFVLDLPS